MPGRNIVITLLTDFGYEDIYVGVMKGVIYKINPQAKIVDISHNVKPQDVKGAAFQLLVSYKYFPEDSIHVVVVDPGVGSRRKILCAQTNVGYFLAPDNGVLAPSLEELKRFELREVKNSRFFLPKVSKTFQGRDKFAPVAAYLSKKNIFGKLGPIVYNYQKLYLPEPSLKKNLLQGEVIGFDRFGNILTNIKKEHFKKYKTGSQPKVYIGNRVIENIRKSYSEVKERQWLALFGSSNLLEISMNLGSAKNFLKTKVGDKIKVIFKNG